MADGQRVGVDEPFTVDGEKLMFPGDASMGASGRNLYNCRSTVKAMIKGHERTRETYSEWLERKQAELEKAKENDKRIAEFKNDLQNGRVNLNLRREKQMEHIAGTKERAARVIREQASGRHSSYFYEKTNVETLISELFGTGKIIYDSEKAKFPTEFVSIEKQIGKAYNYGTQEYADVSRIAIQYSKSGVHAYPVKDW